VRKHVMKAPQRHKKLVDILDPDMFRSNEDGESRLEGPAIAQLQQATEAHTPKVEAPFSMQLSDEVKRHGHVESLHDPYADRHNMPQYEAIQLDLPEPAPSRRAAKAEAIAEILRQRRVLEGLEAPDHPPKVGWESRHQRALREAKEQFERNRKFPDQPAPKPSQSMAAAQAAFITSETGRPRPRPKRPRRPREHPPEGSADPHISFDPNALKAAAPT
jgi:hypothetical protein